jgi:hypothetical protein
MRHLYRMEQKRRRLHARRSHVSHLSLLVEIMRHHARHDSPTEERGKRGSRQRERHQNGFRSGFHNEWRWARGFTCVGIESGSCVAAPSASTRLSSQPPRRRNSHWWQLLHRHLHLGRRPALALKWQSEGEREGEGGLDEKERRRVEEGKMNNDCEEESKLLFAGATRTVDF